MTLPHRLIRLAGALALATGLVAPALAGTPQEDANKKLVIAFYERVLFQLDADAAPEYIGSKYIQHNPNVPDGVAALQGFVRARKAAGQLPASSIKRAFAEGDYVILHVHSKRNAEDRGAAIVDIFRLENGKIVEHWDVVQPVPEKAANDNTMF